MTIVSTCPVETCLREWIAIVRQEAASDADVEARQAARIAVEERASQAIPRSDIGAAFQLLLAITSWPWAHDASDEPEIPDEAMESLTDGTDYKRRLMIGAYFHLTRRLADVDLRDAERWTTGAHVDGGDLYQWLRDAQSTVDIRQLLAA